MKRKRKYTKHTTQSDFIDDIVATFRDKLRTSWREFATARLDAIIHSFAAPSGELPDRTTLIAARAEKMRELRDGKPLVESNCPDCGTTDPTKFHVRRYKRHDGRCRDCVALAKERTDNNGASAESPDLIPPLLKDVDTIGE